MRSVYEANNLIDAYLVRHALEAQGIPVHVRGEALVGGIGELPACGLVAVCVPEACWPEAAALVSQLPLLADTPPAASQADDEGLDDLGPLPQAG